MKIINFYVTFMHFFLIGGSVLQLNFLYAQPKIWESRCISGGGANFSPSISPFDEKKLYLASDVAGIFESNDRGEHWSNVDYRKIKGNKGSKILFTSSKDVMYTTAYPNELAKPAVSKDGGKTWQILNSPIDDEDIYYFLS